MLRSISLCLAISFVFCTVTSAQRHAERGALLGGLTGAMIGAAVGDNNGEGAEGALIGGALGLFSGAALGNAADRDEAQYWAAQQHRQAVHRAQAVSMADVVQMSQSGLSAPVIMNQIRQRGVQRKLQVPDVIFLHQQGVSDAVITTMQQTPVAGGYVAPPSLPRRAPVIVERHHYVSPHPHPYWHRYYHHGYRHHPSHQSRVHFGFSVGR